MKGKEKECIKYQVNLQGKKSGNREKRNKMAAGYVRKKKTTDISNVSVKHVTNHREKKTANALPIYVSFYILETNTIKFRLG